MISFYKSTIRNKNMRELGRFEVGCWIRVVNPTNEELDYLIKNFNLDKHNVYSSIDENEVPRYEKDNKVHYIITKYFYGEKMFTLLIVISDDFILTISKHDFEMNNVITTQRKKMLIKILSKLNYDYEKEITAIVRKVSELKGLDELKEEQLVRLIKYEHILNELLTVYSYLIQIYKKIQKVMKFYEEDKDIVDDLLIEANEGFELCKSSLKAISNIREYYLVLLSNKLNKVITILTIFTIFIDIIAAVSGIYGMNILLPMQKNPYAFWIVMLIILSIWTIMLVIIKRKKMI